MKEAIKQAVRTHLLSFGGSLEPGLEKVVIVGSYALCGWELRHPAGVALLKFQSGAWTVVTGGGGRLSAQEMQAYGVNEALAVQLLDSFF